MKQNETMTSYEKYLYEKFRRLQFHNVVNRVLILLLIIWCSFMQFNLKHMRIISYHDIMDAPVSVEQLEPVEVDVEPIPVPTQN